MNNPRFFRVPEACKFLGGISGKTLREWIRLGIIPALRPTQRCILIEESALLDALKRFSTIQKGGA